jgi:tripartite ATP-independent transporter DctM subunit
MIVYGVLAEVSIAKLFAAGVFPGLIIAALHSGYIALRCTLQPGLAPRTGALYGWRERLAGLVQLLPVMGLILIVLGSIYSGYATPSEAAAVGVAATLALVAATGQLSWRMFADSLMGAVKISAMVCSILVGAAFLSTAMGYLHVPQELAAAIGALELSPYALIVLLALFYIVLGLFLDGISITVMSLPITLPLVVHAGFDPLWFGVFLVIMVEIGQITPPVGFNLFVLQGLTGHSIGMVAAASLPFFCLMLLGVAIVTLLPETALWLPQVLFAPPPH